jgi:hypothetical protein
MELLERLNGLGISLEKQEELELWIPLRVQHISKESLILVREEKESNRKQDLQWPIYITMWLQITQRMEKILQVTMALTEEVRLDQREEEAEEEVEATNLI